MMKKLLATTAVSLFLTSTAAFAHHPAEDIVDPEIYAMIDENVSDTPHADLTFDDRGSEAMTDLAQGGNASSDMVDVEVQGSMSANARR